MAFSQYQQRDHDVVDYQLYEVAGFPYMARGPQPTPGRRSLGIIGAGQSLGVLVREPYADMIREGYDIDILNLSVGGSAPRLYLNNPIAFELLNKTSACIVQVLSARSTTCSYFQTRDGKNMMRPRGSTLPFVPGDTAWDAMFRNEPPQVSALVVKELQRNWVEEMKAVIRSISVPTVLLWFSKRAPGPTRPLKDYRAASGVYPQFVTQEMVDAVAEHCDHYVEATGARGMPNVLTNRFTGEPATVFLGDSKQPKGEDNYYPSPEMHQDAFAALVPTLELLLEKSDHETAL